MSTIVSTNINAVADFTCVISANAMINAMINVIVVLLSMVLLLLMSMLEFVTEAAIDADE